MLFQSTVKGQCFIYRECEVWKGQRTYSQTAELLPWLHKTEHGIIVITFMVAMHASKSLSGRTYNTSPSTPSFLSADVASLKFHKDSIGGVIAESVK